MNGFLNKLFLSKRISLYKKSFFHNFYLTAHLKKNVSSHLILIEASNAEKCSVQQVEIL